MNYVPRRGVFESTLACNLNCAHCGSRAGKARADELSLEECADLFGQLKGLGMEWLTISGGEPTARADWVEVIAAAVDAGLRVGMFTNGLRFDEQAARKAKAAGLTSVAFSVDGMGATHDWGRRKVGHFGRLEKAMAAANAAALPYTILTTLNPRNLEELSSLHEFVADKGAYAWQVQLPSDMGNVRENPGMMIPYRELPRVEKLVASLIKKRRLPIKVGDSLGYNGPFEKTLRTCQTCSRFAGCGAGLSNIGIESNGNIKGCLSIMPGGCEEGEAFVEGNIRDTSLAEIWNRPGAFAYNRQFDPATLTGFCGSCRYRNTCRGGCMGQRIADESPTENRFCTYRILQEEVNRTGVRGQAAAMLLTGLLAGGAVGCQDSGDPDPDPGDTAASTGSDQIDTDTNALDTNALDTNDVVALYAAVAPDTSSNIGDDTNGTVGTDPMAEYGMPPVDTDLVVKYGMPPVDTDTTVSIPLYMMQPPAK